MHDEWQQTDQIVMSVQTAELRQAGVNQSPTLHLSCSLVNIARGQCQLEIAAGEFEYEEDIGNLVIEIDRPLIRGKAIIPRSLHDSIVSCLGSVQPRPISLTLTIGTNLAVSLEGDLRINDVTEVVLKDLSVTLPLK